MLNHFRRLAILATLSFTLMLTIFTSPVFALELEGNWRLVSPLENLPSTEITAEFRNGQINGKAACNSYSGSYQSDESLAQRVYIKIRPVPSTNVDCHSEEYLIDGEYFRALMRADRFETRGDYALILRSRATGTTLRFIKQ